MQAWFLQSPQTVSEKHREKAIAWQLRLTKPAGALGRLETLAVDLAAIQHKLHPSVNHVNICVFAADQGVCAEAVSAFPQVVTSQMLANFAAGGAAISVLAKAIEAKLSIVNLGTIAHSPVQEGILDRSIAAQSGNITLEPAMTEPQMHAAMAEGREAVARAVKAECELFIGGEMGIGNSTTASAILVKLLHLPVEQLVGPGTGVCAKGIAHKIQVIERALARHADAVLPLDILRCLGGFEIAALVGSYIAAAQAGIAVLVDGFICSAAALLACRINPSVSPWLILAHASAEPGHRAAAQALNKEPLLDFELRLGEGSGAALAVPLLRLACELHNNMATFAEAGVAKKE